MPEKLHFHVKYTDPKGRVIIGNVRIYGKEVEEFKARGEVIVDDGVFPRAYIVPEKDIVDIDFELGEYNHETDELIGGDEYAQYQDREFLKARRLSESLPDDGKLHVGDMFRIPVGDGYAWYVVTKVGERRSRIEWRGFGSDRWYDHHFKMGGSFSTKDLLEYVGPYKKLVALFSARRSAKKAS